MTKEMIPTADAMAEPTIPPFNDVTRHNLRMLALPIRHCIDHATFIAIDTEFTGLGGFRTKSQDLRERYKALSAVANEHALIAFGLTTFERKPPAANADTQNPHYAVHNFNFHLLCASPYKVCPESMCFLVDNGFDFNRQFRDGIAYVAGTDPEAGFPADSSTAMLRGVFDHALARKVPIVLHNGLLDLMFIYKSFHADLPDDLDVFISDVADMFKGGIYDTKYVTDYVTHETSSFLAYVYRKYERDQLARKKSQKKAYFTLDIMDRLWNSEEIPLSLAGVALSEQLQMLKKPEDDKNKKKRKPFPNNKPFCAQYAAHGTCTKGRLCQQTHDLDVILDFELRISSKKSKTDTKSTTSTPTPNTAPTTPAKPRPDTSKLPHFPQPTPIPPADSSASLFETYHSACFDAFMTGFVFCHQLLEYPDLLEEAKNKIYLIGKQRPLLIQRSEFAKLSAGHKRHVKLLEG
ncbi:Target of EGR1, member 1 (Nuclear) [Phlyctochytrium bullatum]|nr:Target of EGR1, member 1 (Nuclear) [Phlyctochytrium bullatum]